MPKPKAFLKEAKSKKKTQRVVISITICGTNHATADIQQAPETADEFLAGR
jgi:hypothetical protein